MLATMDTLMGGRAAEELIFGVEKITSGKESFLVQVKLCVSLFYMVSLCL